MADSKSQPTRSLEQLSEKMRDIDFAMLSTHTSGGAIGARPMSNNRQVAFDGTSYFFALDQARSVHDIAADPQVGLSYLGKSGLLGMRPFFVAIEGDAALIRDKQRFQEHWTPDLDRWFEVGADTPGLVLIEVTAKRLHYWDGEDEGEMVLG
jgi:general stress protein 26